MVNFVHSRPILYKIEHEVLFASNCFNHDDFDKSQNNNNLQTLLEDIFGNKMFNYKTII